MLTREQWKCLNALGYYLNQQGIDLDSVAEEDIKIDESAKVYVFLEANIEGVEIVKENMKQGSVVISSLGKIKSIISSLRRKMTNGY